MDLGRRRVLLTHKKSLVDGSNQETLMSYSDAEVDSIFTGFLTSVRVREECPLALCVAFIGVHSVQSVWFSQCVGFMLFHGSACIFSHQPTLVFNDRISDASSPFSTMYTV